MDIKKVYSGATGLEASQMLFDNDSNLNSGVGGVSGDIRSALDITYTSNLFNKGAITRGYWGDNGITFYASNTHWSSDFILVEPGKRYKRVNSDVSFRLYAYDANKSPVVVNDGKVYWQATFENTDIPANVSFVRVLFQSANIDRFMFTLSTTDTSIYIPYANAMLKTASLPILAYSANLFNKDRIAWGFYGTNGITFQASSTYWCSDFIPVEPGKRYKRVNGDVYFYIYAYDANKSPVVVESTRVFWTVNFENTTIPDNVAFVRALFPPANIDRFMFTLSTTDTSRYIPYQVIDPSYLPYSAITTTVMPNTYDESHVGVLDYEEIGNADYSHIIMYGQSLSMGWEAPEAITTENVPGNFMIGDKVAIRHGNNGQKMLTPLTSTMATSCGENPTVAAANAFSKLYRRFVNKTQQFIATSAGEGGQSIECLSKECTNTSGGTASTNYYNVEFLRAVNYTKDTVNTAGKAVSCSAILYMQGEYNYVNTAGLGMTPGTNATTDKNTYKNYLITLKNNMQEDIMASYGQTKRPLFFIYQVAGSYINRRDMSINMSIMEAADENEDIILMNPTYETPDYGGGHLSTNGYRWYGELIAKSLYMVLIKGIAFKPLMPEKVTASGSTVRIEFFSPVLPLLFDNWTKENIADYGFQVFKDGTAVAISSIQLQNNSVILNCSATLTGTIEITYAGQGRNGSGNLRDSDTWRSMYTYYDDRTTSPSKRENYTPLDKPGGTAIYGKPYPLFNWCSNFYWKVE